MREPILPLRILHVFRSPVGGLFRHVCDLVREQVGRGHQVGLICDKNTGGEHAARVLNDLSPHLDLGLSRITMPRHLGASDLAAIRHVARRIAQVAPNVVHGHGAKGGAYARLAIPAGGPIRVYTPHGGSVHYKPGTVLAKIYMALERLLAQRTDLFLFESTFAERHYLPKAAAPVRARVVPNGVGNDEFREIPLVPNATDILFVGELRPLKGVDLLLDALVKLRAQGLPLTTTIVGAGDSRVELRKRAHQLGLDGAIRFVSPIPANQAFALGRIIAVPSRAESFPYIVLEGAAAGKPMVVTKVGGIVDMFGPYANRLIEPNDRDSLARALEEAVRRPEKAAQDARLLREHIRKTFSLDRMVIEGIDAYRNVLAAR